MAFLSKFIRNNFLDVTKKFQTNFEKFDPTDLEVKRAHTNIDPWQVIESKDRNLNKKTLDDIQNAGLL